MRSVESRDDVVVPDPKEFVAQRLKDLSKRSLRR